MNKVKKAIILAAGRGNRLRPRTDTVHKCLTRIQDSTIIHRLLDQLSRNGITQTVIVTGYLTNSIEKQIGNEYKGISVSYQLNAEYLTTNNIVSLQVAKSNLNEPVALFVADIIINESVITDLLTSPYKDVMVVDQFKKNMNGTVVSLDNNNQVLDMLLKKEQSSELNLSDYYKTVNIYRFSQKTACKLGTEIDNCILTNGVNDYYEVAIRNLIRSQTAKFYAVLPNSRKWIEVDTETDLQDAYSLFGS